MIDKITSVFDNYSTKIKNPLIGTIISVWLIHNWRIPYALFNFDSDCTMQDKINFIADYFGKQELLWELVDIIGISFLVLIVTFILMMISRSITDFYYKVAEPFIVTVIDKKEIFTTEMKTKLEGRISNLSVVISERDKEITSLEASNTKLNISISKKDDEIDSLSQINKLNETKISSLNIENGALKDVVKPLEDFFKNFDLLIHQLNTEDEMLIKKYSFVNISFKIESPALAMLLLSHNLVKEQNDKVLFTEGGFDTALMSNAEYLYTDLGKLFAAYLIARPAL
nr:hypothetical protein [uncultured Flavobacterium sp.]